jgi:RNA polymerase sigma-70 factor, ECF subfamily
VSQRTISAERISWLDDAELIGGIKLRDETALALTMQKYSARVYAAALRVLRRPPEAQEVTQDVFLGLWQFPERFDVARGALITWLVILSRSRALDLLRHIQTDTQKISELGSRSGFVSLFAPEQGILFDELLDRLSTKHGRVIEKVFLEGYRLRELAELQNLPLGTVKSQARFALKKLRAELSEKPASATAKRGHPRSLHRATVVGKARIDKKQAVV